MGIEDGGIVIDTLYNINYMPDVKTLKEDFLKELEKLSEEWKECKEKIDNDSTALDNIIYKAEKFLLTVFEAGLYGVVFSEGEKCSIVNLLLDAVKPIQFYARFCFLSYLNRLEGYMLQNRSAIEYFFGFCKSSEQCKGFNEVLETLKDCADLFDTAIEESRDLVNSDMGPCDLERYGASKVPETHTWWPK